MCVHGDMSACGWVGLGVVFCISHVALSVRVSHRVLSSQTHTHTLSLSLPPSLSNRTRVYISMYLSTRYGLCIKVFLSLRCIYSIYLALHGVTTPRFRDTGAPSPRS